jgi:hypothetical protein
VKSKSTGVLVGKTTNVRAVYHQQQQVLPHAMVHVKELKKLQFADALTQSSMNCPSGPIGCEELLTGRCLTSHKDPSLGSNITGTAATMATLSTCVPKHLHRAIHIEKTLSIKLMQECKGITSVRVMDFNESALAAVLTAEKCSSKKLAILFKYAAKNSAVKSLSNLEIIMGKIADSVEVGKMDVYLLWDSVKDVATVPGSVRTALLNELIAIFWKLEESLKSANQLTDALISFDLNLRKALWVFDDQG